VGLEDPGATEWLAEGLEDEEEGDKCEAQIVIEGEGGMQTPREEEEEEEDA